MLPKSQIVSSAISHRMRAVKSKGNKDEALLSKALWNSGYRFRKNNKKIKGTPDISISKYKLAVLVDGEFWHGHNWEKRKLDHKTNIDFWYKKIERNMERDKEINNYLHDNGWTVLRFWSKEIRQNITSVVSQIENVIILNR